MNKKVAAVLAFVLTILVILSIAGITFAEDISNLQTRRNELQEQISQSNEQISDLQIELTENLEQLNTLNEKISSYENDIAVLENNLTKFEEEIQKVNEKLVVIEENYYLQRNALQNRIVALYEVGDIYYLDFLLKSNTLSEFISNCYLVGEIARHDNELLESIEYQKNQIESIKNVLTERQESLKKTKDTKEKIAISLENSKAIRNSYIAKLNNDEKAMQEKIDRYKAELNGLDSQKIGRAHV